LRIFYSFLIIFTSVLFALLPFTGAIHSLLTDLRDDHFIITTDNTSTASVQLFKNIYEDDTSSIVLLSHDASDVPVWDSYNGTTRALVISGLALNSARVIDVTYDVDAINNNYFAQALTVATYVWLVMIALFAIGGLVWLWWHPVKDKVED
jgi:hypothetical protein